MKVSKFEYFSILIVSMVSYSMCTIFKGITVRRDHHYENTEHHVEKTTKIFFYSTICASILYGMVPFLIVFYDLFKEKYTLNSWSLHYNNVWLPFALNSVRRFICVNCVQSASCWTGTTILITIMALFFDIVIYIRAFTEDIQIFFDEMDKLKSERNNERIFKIKMKNVIDFHIKITE